MDEDKPTEGTPAPSPPPMPDPWIAISLWNGSNCAQYQLRIPDEQRAMFLVGWAACAEIVKGILEERGQ